MGDGAEGRERAVEKEDLANMSKRAPPAEEEMEYLGPVRASSVEQMQQQIVDVIRRLEDAGEISIRGAQEEERYIQ